MLRTPVIFTLALTTALAAIPAALSAEELAERAAREFAAQNWTETASAYQQLVAERPGDAPTLLRLGIAQLYLGQGRLGLETLERADAKLVEIGRRADQVVVNELVDQLFPQPLDIHGAS